MTVNDVDIPGDEEIEAALKEALNCPLEQLLSIEEFAQKLETAKTSDAQAVPKESRRAA